MDLWIRSQDKMALAKFDLCVLEQYEGNYMFIADHYKNMGVYKSKERALEVLDEIQNRLNIRHSSEASAEFIVLSEIVPRIYEMPEE